MNDIFLFQKRGSYPHMSVKDTEIWNRFIDKYSTEFLTCQYDFHVGDTAAFDTTMDDGSDTNQDKLYRLRIDVVAKTGRSVCIIEVKPRAGASAIGQLQSYADLYERDGFTTLPIEKILITDTEMPNVDYLCKQAGIKLYVV